MLECNKGNYNGIDIIMYWKLNHNVTNMSGNYNFIKVNCYGNRYNANNLYLMEILAELLQCDIM